jgi:hypothetical protein
MSLPGAPQLGHVSVASRFAHNATRHRRLGQLRITPEDDRTSGGARTVPDAVSADDDTLDPPARRAHDRLDDADREVARTLRRAAVVVAAAGLPSSYRIDAYRVAAAHLLAQR